MRAAWTLTPRQSGISDVINNFSSFRLVEECIATCNISRKMIEPQFCLCRVNAPVKLFCPHPPPGQLRGQRKYACDKKGRGTRKKDDFGDYIGRGK